MQQTLLYLLGSSVKRRVWNGSSKPNMHGLRRKKPKTGRQWFGSGVSGCIRHVPGTFENGVVGSNARKRFETQGFLWCCRRGLNSRPLPYQGSALPLSYGSLDGLWVPQPAPKKKQARRYIDARGARLAGGADTATRLDGGQDRKPSSPRRCRSTVSCGISDGPGTRMTDRNSKEKSQRPSPKDARAERLAEVLRSNLKRRKEAGRGRTSDKDNAPDE